MKGKMSIKVLVAALAVFALQGTLVSCGNEEENSSKNYANAVATLKTDAESGKFYLQLDDTTTVLPTNITASPVGKREVRALVNLKFTKNYPQGYSREAYINWIDTMRTKAMAPSLAEKDSATYGNDPIEIVNHWSTTVEDGYLTLRFRTYFRSGSVHQLNLVKTGKPGEVTLYHNAAGDTKGTVRDGMIAFRLADLGTPGTAADTLTLKWKSYSGNKSVKFKYRPRK